MKASYIIVKIDYNIKEQLETVVRTNAKDEALPEILQNWIRCEIGQGEDNKEPNREDIYKIRITLDLTDGSFYTKSNTGNKDLTCGLVMNVLNMLDKIKIAGLS